MTRESLSESERKGKYLSPTHTRANRVGRLLWWIVWITLFRPTPRYFFAWRGFVLRCFGAKIGKNCHIYPSVVFWAPWNLECGDVVAIADGANIYNTSQVKIGSLAVVSQEAFICCGTHNYTSKGFNFETFPIEIERDAWVAARAIVLPGVTLGQGSVVGAGSVVNRSVGAWTVVAGNPAKVIKVYERI